MTNEELDQAEVALAAADDASFDEPYPTSLHSWAYEYGEDLIAEVKRLRRECNEWTMGVIADDEYGGDIPIPYPHEGLDKLDVDPSKREADYLRNGGDARALESGPFGQAIVAFRANLAVVCADMNTMDEVALYDADGNELSDPRYRRVRPPTYVIEGDAVKAVDGSSESPWTSSPLTWPRLLVHGIAFFRGGVKVRARDFGSACSLDNVECFPAANGFHPSYFPLVESEKP
jgi:hypothetical protein